MEMWFSELHTSNVKLSMRIEEQLCSVESDCQRIDVLVSDESSGAADNNPSPVSDQDFLNQ